MTDQEIDKWVEELRIKIDKRIANIELNWRLSLELRCLSFFMRYTKPGGYTSEECLPIYLEPSEKIMPKERVNSLFNGQGFDQKELVDYFNKRMDMSG